MSKERRLRRIMHRESQTSLILPTDDSAIDGPKHHLRDMRGFLEKTAPHLDAVLGFQGTLKTYEPLLATTGRIQNLSLSTSLMTHTRKFPAGMVADALRDDMDAVAVHVNFSSMYEQDMLERLGQVGSECTQARMPLVVFTYPRTEGTDGKDNNYYEMRRENPEAYTKIARHCARIGVELGADLIKIPYTGTPETFQTVIKSTMGIPVVMAGGPKIATERFLQNTYEAMEMAGLSPAA